MSVSIKVSDIDVLFKSWMYSMCIRMTNCSTSESLWALVDNLPSIVMRDIENKTGHKFAPGMSIHARLHGFISATTVRPFMTLLIGTPGSESSFTARVDGTGTKMNLRIIDRTGAMVLDTDMLVTHPVAVEMLNGLYNNIYKHSTTHATSLTL